MSTQGIPERTVKVGDRFELTNLNKRIGIVSQVYLDERDVTQVVLKDAETGHDLLRCTPWDLGRWARALPEPPAKKETVYYPLIIDVPHEPRSCVLYTTDADRWRAVVEFCREAWEEIASEEEAAPADDEELVRRIEGEMSLDYHTTAHLAVEPPPVPEDTTTMSPALKQAIDVFVTAGARLLTALNRSDRGSDADAFAEGYPFVDSFDEVLSKMVRWAEAHGA
jgi:hypothetical protein